MGNFLYMHRKKGIGLNRNESYHFTEDMQAQKGSAFSQSHTAMIGWSNPNCHCFPAPWKPPQGWGYFKVIGGRIFSTPGPAINSSLPFSNPNSLEISWEEQSICSPGRQPVESEVHGPPFQFHEHAAYSSIKQYPVYFGHLEFST